MRRVYHRCGPFVERPHLLSSDLTLESNRRQKLDSKKQALCTRGLRKPPKCLIRSECSLLARLQRRSHTAVMISALPALTEPRSAPGDVSVCSADGEGISYFGELITVDMK